MVTTVTGFLIVFKDAGLVHSDSAAGTNHARSSLQSVLDKSRRKRFRRAYCSRFVAGHRVVLS